METDLPTLRLWRMTALPDECLLGVLRDLHGEKIALTLELPWRNNAIGKSCIPAGNYEVKRWHSSVLGTCYAFDDSETFPRTAIRIHVANWARDLRGCIALGKTTAMLEGLPAVTSSRETLNKVLGDYPKGFCLHVTNELLE